MKVWAFLASLLIVASVVAGVPFKKSSGGGSAWGPLVYGHGLNSPFTKFVSPFKIQRAIKVAKLVPGTYVNVEYDGDIELTDRYGREVDIVDSYGREMFDD